MASGKPYETIVTVYDKMGLHARPATILAKLCSEFSADLTLERLDGSGESADCRSTLALLMLAAPCGTQLRLKASGSDANVAYQRVVALFESWTDNQEPD